MQKTQKPEKVKTLSQLCPKELPPTQLPHAIDPQNNAPRDPPTEFIYRCYHCSAAAGRLCYCYKITVQNRMWHMHQPLGQRGMLDEYHAMHC